MIHLRTTRPSVQLSPWRWGAQVSASELREQWQHDLLPQVVARTTVQVWQGSGRLALAEAQILSPTPDGCRLDLLEREVGVWLNYPTLARQAAGLAPSCRLALHGSAGRIEVVLPVPAPPTRADWQQVLADLWIQLQLDPDLSFPPLPVWLLRAGGVRTPLYRWRLHPRLVWLGRAGSGESARWPDRLRLTCDSIRPGMLRIEIGWGRVGGDEAGDGPDEQADGQHARGTGHLHARLRWRWALLVGGLLLLLVGLVVLVAWHQHHLFDLGRWWQG